jgi:gliding motility-associated-like protein
VVDEPDIFLTLETVNPHCYPDDGVLKAVPQGGSGKYFYAWSNGRSEQSIARLSHGSYSVVVTDEYGCTASEQAVLDPPPPPIQLTLQASDAVCAPDDGGIRANILGGQAPYSFLWSTGDTTRIVTGMSAGTYSIKVKDANECERTAQAYINPPPPLLQIEATSEDAVCNEHDGKLAVAMVGGTAPYHILWSPSGETAATVDNVTVGEYAVRVTDDNGCVQDDVATVNAPDNLMAVLLEASGESYGLKNGWASAQVLGGLPPYSYQWEPTGGSDVRAEALSAGLYTLAVIDANACLVSDTISVIALPPVDIPNAFTPNGDMYNENWEIKHVQYYPATHVKIYDRWGNLIFERRGYDEPWDGDQLPGDTYYYIIDLNIGIKPFVGYVDIIR